MIDKESICVSNTRYL